MSHAVTCPQCGVPEQDIRYDAMVAEAELHLTKRKLWAEVHQLEPPVRNLNLDYSRRYVGVVYDAEFEEWSCLECGCQFVVRSVPVRHSDLDDEGWEKPATSTRKGGHS